eukprot:TRINITY_DN13357_c0_g1_i1.p1 TRINITY_DN13357_c0_g1~~TRINITY_DN13357_c0_g1_i1.p1  ORF type:complete len:1058 (+),score=274.98 TRINITY_DN13357_c0_g1_i1:334-3507(+)
MSSSSSSLSNDRPTKRRKIDQSGDNLDDDERVHVNGSIVRVSLDNFMTYDHADVYPGPNLNVLIGPNGSGKSSIVCAIALGLAGKTSVLGRARDFSDFIKHGCSQASIEIELKNRDGENTVIRREMTLGSKSCVWYCNGRKVTKTQIAKITKKLNIQVDNLCQFLPQDKVVSFAAMDSKKLLVETEKAISEKLFTMHDQLAKLQKTHTDTGKSLYQDKKRIDELVKKNEALETDVARFKKIEKYRNLKKDMESYMPWLDVIDAQGELKETKRLYQRINQELEELKATIQPKKDLLDQALQQYNKSSETLEKYKKNLSALEKQRHSVEEKIESYVEDIDKEHDNMKRLKHQAKNDKRKREETQSKINEYKEKLASMRDPREILDRIREIKEEVRLISLEERKQHEAKYTLESKIREIDFQIRTAKKKLEEFGRQKNRIKNKVYRDFSHVGEALNWINEHQSQLKGRVYGPVILEMRPYNEQYAQYIENYVPPAVLIKTFIPVDPDDRDFLHEHLIRRQKKNINLTYIPPHIINSELEQTDINHFKRYGFECYLSDTFDAEPVIKQVLNRNNNLHMVLVGTNEAEKNLEAISQDPYCQLFLTPESFYSSRRSKYGNRNVSVSSRALKPVRFFSPEADPSIIQDLENEILQCETNRSDLEQQIRELSGHQSQSQRDELENEKRSLETLDKQRFALESKIKQLEQVLSTFDDRKDLETQKEEIKNRIEKINKLQLRDIGAMFDVMKRIFALTGKIDLFYLKLVNLEARKDQLQQEYTESSHKLKEVNENINSIGREYQRKKDRLIELTRIADRGMKKDSETFKKYAGLERVQIEVALEKYETKISAIHLRDDGVVAQYEAREKEIADLREKYKEAEGAFVNKQNHMKQLREKWEPQLQELVERINEKFSLAFSEIGCEGVVELNKNSEGEEDDVENWGMEIKVKYRDNEELRKLDSHSQSGGERSVATMLYLISLQDITLSPFRLVDEINQGMDPYNERMIFDQVVRTACRPHTPQYFLITPKLLSNLNYSEKVTVLCVLNGPYVPEDWKMMEELEYLKSS